MDGVLGPAVLIGLALWCNGCGGCDEGLAALEITSDDGEVALALCVGVASTEKERQIGLSGQQLLSSDEGLLLDFPLTQDVCIQNETVAFSIDVLFVDDRHQIVSVAREVPGKSTELICRDGVRQVLEVAGGAAANVDVGFSIELEN